MIKEHAAAVLALLNAQTSPIQLTVFDGVVPDDTDPYATPYVLVRFNEGRPELNFQGVIHEYTLDITTFSVAGTDSAVRTVVDRVRTALLDVTPTVAGRKCYPIRWASSSPVQPIERTGPTTSSMIVSFHLRSIPG